MAASALLAITEGSLLYMPTTLPGISYCQGRGTATLIGLLPIMWGMETGSEIMKRIAAPMVGGLISSTFLTRVIIPAVYALRRGWNLRKGE